MDHAHTTPLSRRQKAAAIVQLMVDKGQVPDLKKLPESAQHALIEALGELRRLTHPAMQQIITEFTEEIDSIALNTPGSRDGAIVALADHISPPLAESLRQTLNDVVNGDHWPLVAGLSEEVLCQAMQSESVEVAAIALSKIPTAKAAAVLSKMPGDRARRITYAMSKTAQTGPDTVRKIGAALAQDYGHPAARAFDKPPVQRLGAILNSTQSDTREDVLAALDQEDQPFASDVRKAIFTFKDIASRVKATDIPNCIRAVDGEVLTTALAAAMSGDDALKASAEFILSSLSQRMAGQLRDDVTDRGKVKKDDAEIAMAEVTKVIREMVDGGVISLIDPDEGDEEVG